MQADGQPGDGGEEPRDPSPRSSPGGARRLVARVVLACFAALVPFLMLEAGLRILQGPPPDRITGSKVPDPVLGWRPPASSGYRHVNHEFDVAVSYNRHGWRDVEHDTAKPPGTFRIVVLGDSFMEANSVRFEGILARQLERLSRNSGREVEVINLGVGGFGTLQQLLMFEHEGRRYQPDLVLVGTYLGNDVRNNSRDLEERLWTSRKRAQEISVTTRPFLVPGGDDDWTVTRVDYDGAKRRFDAAVRDRSEGLDSLLQRKSRVYSLLRAKVKQWTSRGQSGQLSYDAVDFEAWMGVYRCETQPDHEQAWAVTRRIFARLASAVREAGADLVVFTVPARQEVEPGFRDTIRSRLPDPDLYCIEQAPGNRRLAEIADELDFQLIDLLPEFRRAGETRTLFWDSDDHWNDEGHAIASQRVFDALVTQRLLP